MKKMTLMLTKQVFVLIALLTVSHTPLLAQDTSVAAPALTLKVTPDRPDALYHVGESVTFTVSAMQGDQPATVSQVVCVVSKDGWKPQPPQTLEINDGKATLTSKLDEPGFLQVRVTSGKSSAVAGVGYDPLLIPPSMPVPDDFDQFWDTQKAALAKVPLKSTLTPVSQTAVKNVDAFDVQIDCLGPPVSGYFGRPQNAQPGSLPAILFVHGAGVRSANLGSISWATQQGGMLSFDINAHGIPNGKPAEFYETLKEGELKDYRSMGRADREECYFKGMFLRLIRAIDFLTAQPEWDGKTLIVYGSSQGGFQALAATGLDARVTHICAGVPAGCDHTGNTVNRISGWPKLVPLDSNGQPNAAVLQSSRYFDCVNFATHAKCKTAAVTVGFIDTVCPPTSVYAAYNALTMPKTIFNDILAGHTNTPAAVKFMQNAVARHVEEMK